MKYKPELGSFGNLTRLFSELTNTNRNVFNTNSEVQQVAGASASWDDIAAAITEGVNDVE